MNQPEAKGPARSRLGRGLTALIGGGPRDDEHTESADADSELRQIRTELIARNPFQPRKDFGEKDLEELTESIRQHGVLQPLLVRSHADGFQLIAGERRWRAAKKAGLDTVPCRLLELEDQDVNEAAIEENLKRKDLNVLEKAQAFRDYLDRFGCSIEEMAQKLSMTRTTASNILRLLELPEAVQELVRANKISGGHARAVLPLPEEGQLRVCERIQSETLSVRKTEAAVRAILKGEPTVPFKPEQPSEPQPQPTSHVLSLQDQLRDQLGARVEIRLRGKDSGHIVIRFDSNDEFERILRNLRRAA